jgi:hypothetical protein
LTVRPGGRRSPRPGLCALPTGVPGYTPSADHVIRVGYTPSVGATRANVLSEIEPGHTIFRYTAKGAVEKDEACKSAGRS